MRLFIGYCTILAPLKDMARRHIASWERGRCPRADLQSAPGRLGYQSPGIMTGAGGASLDWDRRRRVTPVQTASQEAWPEAEPLGWNNSLRREPRWNADKRARSKRARAASQDAAVVTLRLPAFRFLHLFLEVLSGEAQRTNERQAPPLAFLFPE